ncbi:MAG: DUF1846 domain-containing protein [Lachnospiraceae bacterium]|nr:DUF1846 domain-containing protein [Lachnospiraceae bacterium]
MSGVRYGFDSEKYTELQSQHIKERIDQFGKLYLEFGGKLYDDYHASRVLPGFAPDNKIKMLSHLKNDAEIIIAISAAAIEQNKVRGDLGITYDADVLRLKSIFENSGFYVGSVVITQYTGQPAADRFREKLTALGIRSYLHYVISEYPANVPLIVSEDGYGKNDFIETSRNLVIVTAPGPGSGKMATCLSQLYHENKRGVKAGYAKFETFPVWNLPLQHPINLAYEAATADLDDVNMIDPFHLEAYGKMTVNYNRDVEIFPVLRAIFEGILGECPYKSPTDMGVNMLGFAISDEEVCKKAAKQEIIRRYFTTACEVKKGNAPKEELYKEELLLKKVGVTPEDRPVVVAASDRERATGHPAVAIEIADGRIVTGKTSDLLGAAAACLMNALKVCADIPHDMKLVSAEAISPIQTLKTQYLGGTNPRLHTDEILIALSASASDNELAKKAMEQLPLLRGAQAHSTVILSSVDINTFRKLGVSITCSPVYEEKIPK